MPENPTERSPAMACQRTRSASRGAPRCSVLRLVGRQFQGSAPGAILYEYLILVGACALVAIIAFNRFGRSIHQSFRTEAAHIRGEGLPNAADLLDQLGGLSVPEGACTTLPGGGRICVGGSQLCFAAGTLVATEHGDRPIESLVPGDRVLSKDVTTNELALKPVLTTYTTERVPVIAVDLESSALVPERVHVTAGHRFWAAGEGWVRADQLASTPLEGSTGSQVLGTPTPGEELVLTVYNIEVADFHTYFVGRAQVLVKNQNGDPDACPDAGTGIPQATATPQELQDCRSRRSSIPMSPATPGGASSRPADAMDRLCQSSAVECRNAPDRDACEKKWDCVTEWVGKHPTSEYFSSPSTAARIQRQCSSQGADVTACYNGPSTSVSQGSLSPQYQQEIAQAARDRQTASTPQEARDASEEAGNAAAAGYAALQYPQPPWTCPPSPLGAREFDLVCYSGSRVVVLEAKGGGSSLGTRWDKDGEQRVQQGTNQYVEAVAADMSRRDPALARRIQRALLTGTLEYLRVDQKFDSSGNPRDVAVRSFAITPAARAAQGCPP